MVHDKEHASVALKGDCNKPLPRSFSMHSTYTKKWAATSSVCSKRGVGASLLFFKLGVFFTAAVSPETTGKGKRAKVELDWLFARVSPVPKHDRRSSSATLL